jgi:hypothetical protein
VLTALVTVLISVVPGGLLGFAVPSGRARWATFASAPVLTLGLTAASAAWLGAIGLPNSVQAVLVLEFAFALVIIAVGRVLARRGIEVTPHHAAADDADDATMLDESSPGYAQAAGSTATATVQRTSAPAASRAGALDRLRGAGWLPDLLALGVPSVIALVFGHHLLGRLRYPPGWDAMNHGILTRDMLKAASTSMSSACVTGSTHGQVACSFYPLATDISWGQGAVLSGGDVSTAMLAWSEVVGPLAFVAAVFTAVRILGGRPVVAGAASLACVFLSPIWAALITGRPPEAFGSAFAVAIAVLARLALRGAHPAALGLYAGIGVGGVVMTHSYDVLFAVVLTAAFVLAGARGIRLRPTAVGVVGLVAGAAFSLAPYGKAISTGGSERSLAILPPRFDGRLGAAIHYWIFEPQRYVVLGYPSPDATHHPHALAARIGLSITVVCLAASISCLVYRSLRWARPWLATWAVWMAIAVWTSTSNGALAKKLSGLWYAVNERERVMLAPLYGVLVVAGACGIGLTAQWLLSALRAHRLRVRPGLIAAPLAAALAVAAIVGVTAVRSSRIQLQEALVRHAPRGAMYPEMFAWLADHTPKGAVLGYIRHRQFMTWSYADDGVGLLFGMTPVRTQAKHDYDLRTMAWNWLVDNPDSSPAGCLVRKYNIAYVVVGGHMYPERISMLTYFPDRIDNTPRLRLAHRDGTIRAYAVTAAGRSCKP